MLGAGIYVLVGKVAGYAGSLAPLSFLIAGVLAGLTAYSYSLLAPRFPKSGGEIEYVRAATQSKKLASIVGWGVIFTGFISAAAIVKGFVGYLDVPVNTFETDEQGIGTIEVTVEQPEHAFLRASRIGALNTYPTTDLPNFVRVIEVSPTISGQTFDITFDPYYSYTLKSVNLNCTGPTDSVWIESPPSSYLFTSQGCDDKVFIPYPYYMEGEYVLDTNTVTFNITTKKSGVITTFSESHNLTLGVLEEITIEY
jgi:amino acid transporter